MEQEFTLTTENIGEVISELAKMDSFWFVCICLAIVLGLILLFVVRLIHWRVIRKYTRVSGMYGLDEEEKKDRSLKQEEKELNQAIREHETAIRKYREMRNTIRILSESGSR